MAAYAALLSVKFILNQIQQHTRPPISLDQQQIHSLTANLSFLQKFLEDYSNKDDGLEGRIADAAYEAEDVIESHIVDQIHAQYSTSSQHENMMTCVDLYRSLERVIQEMDSIKKEVMEIIKEMKMGAQLCDQLIMNSIDSSTGQIKPISRMQNNTMVHFGDIFNDVMDKLTRQEYDLEIVPIVGMGGMGKTTLATNVYAHPLIVEHFDILVWVTISQEYSVREILLRVLSEERNRCEKSEEHKLGERVYKKLWGRRYLIVMADIWSIEVWDKVKAYFPNNNKGSKIMITTRNSNLAFQLSGSHDFQIKFLDDVKSWDLLCNIVFGKECCPIELEGIGKEIARNCRGLPLSIVVVAGLLAKANKTQAYWQYNLENLSSQINLENNEHCLQILRRSYMELPIYLKPCFLYMSIFPEDYKISVPRLIRLWVAEGFLKPIDNRSLEEVAKEYFNELIERNLILVHELRWNGKAKACRIHDLLRDVCLREARKQRFICVLRGQDLNIPEDINMERRLCIHDNTKEKLSPQLIHVIESASLTRSLILFVNGFISIPPPSLTSRLLRTLDVIDYHSMSYIATAPSDIWEMSHLRHVRIFLFQLPNPPCGEDEFVLANLQTLLNVVDFKCSEDVVKRILNIKKLRLRYNRDRLEKEGLHSFRFKNLCRLRNLTSLSIDFGPAENPETFQNLSLPHSLKKLCLSGTRLLWEDMTSKIGSLSLLEVLKLGSDSCIGPEWETIEGQFCSLKFLLISHCDLRCWASDDTDFPRLEHLVLYGLSKLEEIPSSIGDIPTLRLIKLVGCLESAKASAERIKEEQVNNGNEDLQVLIGY